MKFKDEDFEDKTLSVYKYALDKLDGSDYDCGAIENMEAAVSNLTRAFAKLLSIFSDKHLTKEQIKYVLDKYKTDVEGL